MTSRVQRVDELSNPLDPGRFYLVPTVRATWCGRLADWPVMGELHDDTKFFHFPYPHYHLDRRFLANRHVEVAISRPLHARLSYNDPPLPSPLWARRKCLRAAMNFPVWPEPVCEMQAALGGAQCARSANGWICPHRRFDLSTIQPDERGIITCPLHGLRINEMTGRVLTRDQQVAA